MLNERLLNASNWYDRYHQFSSLLLLKPYLTTVSSQIAGTVAAGLASVGIYKLLAGGLMWLFQRWQLMRKLMLGRSFLEGHFGWDIMSTTVSTGSR